MIISAFFERQNYGQSEDAQETWHARSLLGARSRHDTGNLVMDGSLATSSHLTGNAGGPRSAGVSSRATGHYGKPVLPVRTRYGLRLLQKEWRA